MNFLEEACLCIQNSLSDWGNLMVTTCLKNPGKCQEI